MPAVSTPTDANLDRAVSHLLAGELVGLPTETVYGLAGLGLSAEAVARIYAAKDRPSFNPLILHTTQSLEELNDGGIIDLNRLSPRAQRAATLLARAAWPGPLTLVLPRGRAVPDLTTAGLDTVAVRQPRHRVAQAILQRLGQPLAAPSANQSGRISPTTAQSVVDEMGSAVAMVIDGGACEVGVESTVVHVGDDGDVTLLRPGMYPSDAIVSVLGREMRPAAISSMRPRSPGAGSSHYAPRAPFLRLPARLPSLSTASLQALKDRGARHSRISLLCWSADHAAQATTVDLGRPLEAVFVDADGDPVRTAQGLYQTLRQLDTSGGDLLLAEPFPPDGLARTGLGFALADRVGRATTPWSPTD